MHYLFLLLKSGINFPHPNIIEYSFVLSLVIAFVIYVDSVIDEKKYIQKLIQDKSTTTRGDNSAFNKSVARKVSSIIDFITFLKYSSAIAFMLYLLALIFYFSEYVRNSYNFLIIFQVIIIWLLLMMVLCICSYFSYKKKYEDIKEAILNIKQSEKKIKHELIQEISNID
ncbi:MAG: hypothetical protein AAF611_02080 [Bacteroidota bacterium]